MELSIFNGIHRKNRAPLIRYLQIILLSFLAAACAPQPSLLSSRQISSQAEPTPVVLPVIADNVVIQTFRDRAKQICKYLNCTPNSIIQNLRAVHGFSTTGNLAETTDNGIDVFTADPRINAEIIQSIATHEILNFTAPKKPTPSSFGFLQDTAFIRGVTLSYDDMSEFELSQNIDAHEVCVNSLGQQLHEAYPFIPYDNPSHNKGGALLSKILRNKNIPLSIQLQIHTESDIEKLLGVFGMSGRTGYKAFVSALNYANGPNHKSPDQIIQHMQQVYKSLRKN